MYHNTIFGAKDDGISVEGTGAIIQNNIIVGSAGFGIRLNGGSITTESNNLITDATTGPANLAGRTFGFAASASSLNANPNFVNAGAGNFNLLSTSPAKDAGLNLGANQPDRNGAVAGLFNSTAPDIGAFELAANNAPINLYAVPTITNTNILGYYGFNNAATIGNDDAGNASPITFFGSPTLTNGPTGSNALNLEGGASGQYGNLASITTGGAMTIAARVKFDTTGNWERVIDLGQANAAGIGNIVISRNANTNNLSFTIEKQGFYVNRATANGVITNTNWMHVAATVDNAGQMSLYVNGSLAASFAGVAPDVGIRTNGFIGRSNFAGDSAFDGAIDDLLIANGAIVSGCDCKS